MPRRVVSLLNIDGAELFVRRYFFSLLVFSASFGVLVPEPTAKAHQDHKHASPVSETNAQFSRLKAAIGSIAKDYENRVKPIFQKSCLDCHSSQTHYPWYSRLPFVKGMIEQDITEARKHLDVTSGYPFKGHGNLASDLEAIRDAITGGSMPPQRYLVLHWSAKLSQSEKEVVIQWAEMSLKTISGETKN